MTRHTTGSLLILLLAALGGCSKESTPPTTQTPSKETPAAPAPAPQPAPAPPVTAAIKTGDTNFPGVAADVTECRRKDGVLSLRLRFRTASDKKSITIVDGRDYE